MRTYYWDFVGPRGAGTAEHYVRHLGEFLEQQALDGCEVGMQSPAPMHHVAFLRAPAEHHASIERALRPRRFEEE